MRGKKGRRRWERGGREEKGRRKREKKRGWRLFEGGDYRRREWRKWGGCWREGRKRRRKMEEREKGGWRGEERSDGREKKRGRATGERGAPGSCCFRRLLVSRPAVSLAGKMEEGEREGRREAASWRGRGGEERERERERGATGGWFFWWLSPEVARREGAGLERERERGEAAEKGREKRIRIILGIRVF